MTEASKVGWASKNKGESIVLDESSVLAVTDSVGNITYSVRMYVPGTPFNVFHNMIVKQTPKGKMNEPFILRYEVAEAYRPTYVSSDRADAPFRGEVEVDVYSIAALTPSSFEILV